MNSSTVISLKRKGTEGAIFKPWYDFRDPLWLGRRCLLRSVQDIPHCEIFYVFCPDGKSSVQRSRGGNESMTLSDQYLISRIVTEKVDVDCFSPSEFQRVTSGIPLRNSLMLGTLLSRYPQNFFRELLAKLFVIMLSRQTKPKSQFLLS